MPIHLKFSVADYEDERPLSIPMAIRCDCATTFVDFELDERIPSDAPINRHASMLKGQGWSHRYTVLPKTPQSVAHPVWSVFENTGRSLAVADDLIHVFLVESIVSRKGWMVYRPKHERARTLSAIMFVKNPRRADRALQASGSGQGSSVEADGQPGAFPIPVVDSNADPFDREFQDREAYIPLSTLRMLPADFSREWK